MSTGREHRADAGSIDRLSRALIDVYQRDLPIAERPYACMGERVDASEAEVIDRLRELSRCGILSRVGPVFAPHRAGASTLAAMSVPRERLEAVAGLVSARPEVNHNYEREHELNLWFVVTAPDEAGVHEALASIAHDTGIEPLDLPMQHAYHIDLGFSPWGSRPARERPHPPSGVRGPKTDTGNTRYPADGRLEPLDRRVIAAIQGGLALVPRPFDAVAERVGCDAATTMARIERLAASGVIKRFGLIVRHLELGYLANGMMVMDVADARVDAVGARLARMPAVTLCYRRPRRPPRWPFNLFCMIHGRERGAVLATARRVREAAALDAAECEVLFSARRFKQRGAWYAEPAADTLAAGAG